MKTEKSPLCLAFACLCALGAAVSLVVALSPHIRMELLSYLMSTRPEKNPLDFTGALERIAKALTAVGVFMAAALLFESQILAFAKKHIMGVAVISVLAIILRFQGFPFLSHDWVGFILPWIEGLACNGHFFGIASIHSDYPPFYLCILSVISFLPEALWLPAVKLTSCLFDFGLAAVCAAIILSVCGQKHKAFIVYAAVLFSPTVFFNSAIWGQCDSIYALFVFLSLLLFIKGRSAPALCIFGFALSIKLQSIFVLPFIVFLYLYGKFKFENIFFSIIGFAATAIVGLPFAAYKQFIAAFYSQTARPSPLTVSAPSVFALFKVPESAVPLMGKIGILFVFAVLAFFALWILYMEKNKVSDRGTGKNISIVGTDYITLFFFSALIVPYFLPHMLERYFYLAETASIIYAVLFPKRWWIPLLLILPTCASCLNLLFENDANLAAMSQVILVAVVFIFKWTAETISQAGRGNLTVHIP